MTGPLRQALDALAEVAGRSGLPAQAARQEGLLFAAAIAESAPGAALDWAAAQDGGPRELGPANSAFFDAASRGRKWRQSPTTLLAELAATDRVRAAEYATALAEVASAACTLGEPTVRVTGNASVAAAAQLGAAAPASPPPDAHELLGRLPGWDSSGALVLDPYLLHGPVSARDGGAVTGPRDVGAARGPDDVGAARGPGGGDAGDAEPRPPGDAGDAEPRPPGDAGDAEPRPPGEAAAAGQTPGEPADPEPQDPPRSLEELLADLDAMVGLARVKREVHQQVAVLKVDAMRRAAGLRSPNLTRHLVFVGNPGTGKTTVARMVGGIYRALGLLTKGQLVEVDRSELVAGYLGQTAIKTAEVCAKAYGGVLFIDEAYALSGDQYGQEAVNTLVKEMEDHRDDLVVIVAGYPDPMVVFIAQNPGLASRFKTVIEFEDYTDDEIVGILHKLADGSDYTVTGPAEARFRGILAGAARDQSFGNGRFARNALEEAIGRQAWRLRDSPDPTPQQLRELLAEDFQTSEDVQRDEDVQPGGGVMEPESTTQTSEEAVELVDLERHEPARDDSEPGPASQQRPPAAAPRPTDDPTTGAHA